MSWRHCSFKDRVLASSGGAFPKHDYDLSAYTRGGGRNVEALPDHCDLAASHQDSAFFPLSEFRIA